MTQEQNENLRRELEKLHHRKELSRTVGPDYFEPGMMEYLDQSEGIINEANGEILIRFEAKGTRYEGRTEQIETVSPGDVINVVRDEGNSFNSNNFTLLTKKGQNVGNMPAELCNVLAPIYDNGELVIIDSRASYVEPISRRSRHAKQAILFIELKCNLRRNNNYIQ